ncbi:Peroxidase [Parasponia andersonii]|uniref:peroxidase n=1 Tax=Parasponia andersonii TaxID=3476 RepID=A0A2P5DJG9_PARAD|nr:Peroxidase [Parasponia andersonii]
MLSISYSVASLSLNHCDNTCPHLDCVVESAVKTAMSNDKTVPATLLRMHFHDCFIRGCDGSVSLESKGKNKAEKDGPLVTTIDASLRSICAAHNEVRNAGTSLDSTTTTFDNAYYKLLLQGKIIFSSDQALLTTPKTKALVSKYATSKQEFEKAFVESMIKMSNINGGQGIRHNCKVVN